MIAHTYYPTAPLAGFVDLMWLYEDYRVPHAQERLLPTGTTSLVQAFGRRPAEGLNLKLLYLLLHAILTSAKK